MASLQAIHGAIDQHLKAPHQDEWQRTLYLRAAALRAANIMSNQAENWRALIAQQKSDLPA